MALDGQLESCFQLALAPPIAGPFVRISLHFTKAVAAQCRTASYDLEMVETEATRERPFPQLVSTTLIAAKVSASNMDALTMQSVALKLYGSIRSASARFWPPGSFLPWRM